MSHEERFYDDIQAQEILRLAAGYSANRLSRSHILQTAAELGIPPEAVAQAEAEVEHRQMEVVRAVPAAKVEAKNGVWSFAGTRLISSLIWLAVVSIWNQSLERSGSMDQFWSVIAVLGVMLIWASSLLGMKLSAKRSKPAYLIPYLFIAVITPFFLRDAPGAAVALISFLVGVAAPVEFQQTEWMVRLRTPLVSRDPEALR
jgi:hypothetical protein